MSDQIQMDYIVQEHNKRKQILENNIEAVQKRIELLQSTIPAVLICKEWRKNGRAPQIDLEKLIEAQIDMRKKKNLALPTETTKFIEEALAVANDTSSVKTKDECIRKLKLLKIQERLIKGKIDEMATKEHAYKKALEGLLCGSTKPCADTSDLPFKTPLENCNCKFCKCLECLGLNDPEKKRKRLESEKKLEEMKAERIKRLEQFIAEQQSIPNLRKATKKLTDALNVLQKEYTNLDCRLISDLKKANKMMLESLKCEDIYKDDMIPVRQPEVSDSNWLKPEPIKPSPCAALREVNAKYVCGTTEQLEYPKPMKCCPKKQSHNDDLNKKPPSKSNSNYSDSKPYLWPESDYVIEDYDYDNYNFNNNKNYKNNLNQHNLSSEISTARVITNKDKLKSEKTACNHITQIYQNSNNKYNCNAKLYNENYISPNTQLQDQLKMKHFCSTNTEFDNKYTIVENCLYPYMRHICHHNKILHETKFICDNNHLTHDNYEDESSIQTDESKELETVSYPSNQTIKSCDTEKENPTPSYLNCNKINTCKSMDISTSNSEKKLNQQHITSPQPTTESQSTSTTTEESCDNLQNIRFGFTSSKSIPTSVHKCPNSDRQRYDELQNININITTSQLIPTTESKCTNIKPQESNELENICEHKTSVQLIPTLESKFSNTEQNPINEHSVCCIMGKNNECMNQSKGKIVRDT